MALSVSICQVVTSLTALVHCSAVSVKVFVMASVPAATSVPGQRGVWPALSRSDSQRVGSDGCDIRTLH